MRDEVSYCTTDLDFFGIGARELAFRVAKPYLEQEGITTMTLAFGRLRQKVLVNDGNRVADMLLRVATAQCAQTRMQVPDRQAELDRLVINAVRRIDLLTRQTPPDFVVEGKALSDVATEEGDGPLRAGIIVSAKLADMDWAAKASLCLDLMEGGATGVFASHLDQTLAELVRLAPAMPAFGFTGDRLNLVELCLLIAGDMGATAPRNEAINRLVAQIALSRLPLVVSAAADLLTDALQNPALMADTAVAELDLLCALRARIESLVTLKSEQPLHEALRRRFARLAGAELLNRALTELPAYGRKALHIARLYAEVGEGEARTDLLASLTFHLEHRDFKTAFVEPGTDRAEALSLAEALGRVFLHPSFPEHRQERFRDFVATTIANLQKGTDTQRDPRVVGGADDNVVVAGEAMRLHNWSPVGLLFGPAKKAPAVGAVIDVTVTVRNIAIDIRFNAKAEVMKVTNGLIAARYRCADEGAAKIIKQYFVR